VNTVLHHVQVACPRDSEPAVRAFYGMLLGLPEVAKPAELARRGGVWFRGPGSELHVGVEEPFSPARKALTAGASAAFVPAGRFESRH